MLPETKIEMVAMSIGSEADNPANSTYKSTTNFKSETLEHSCFNSNSDH